MFFSLVANQYKPWQTKKDGCHCSIWLEYNYSCMLNFSKSGFGTQVLLRPEEHWNKQYKYVYWLFPIMDHYSTLKQSRTIWLTVPLLFTPNFTVILLKIKSCGIYFQWVYLLTTNQTPKPKWENHRYTRTINYCKLVRFVKNIPHEIWCYLP